MYGGVADQVVHVAELLLADAYRAGQEHQPQAALAEHPGQATEHRVEAAIDRMATSADRSAGCSYARELMPGNRVRARSGVRSLCCPVPVMTPSPCRSRAGLRPGQTSSVRRRAPAAGLPPEGPELGGDGEQVVAALRRERARPLRRAGVERLARADPHVPGRTEDVHQVAVVAEHGRDGVVHDRGRTGRRSIRRVASRSRPSRDVGSVTTSRGTT